MKLRKESLTVQEERISKSVNCYEDRSCWQRKTKIQNDYKPLRDNKC